jgi:hypothetical protein
MERPELIFSDRPTYESSFRPSTGTGRERPVRAEYVGPGGLPQKGERPKPPSIGGGDDDAASPPDAPVKLHRTADDLVIPPAANADHPDLEIKLNDQKTLKLRWDDDLGYVVIGEKNGSGEMHLYTQAEFADANKGQLTDSGGGHIPEATNQKPEFYVPPEGTQSLIYRYDPATQKDVIVGYRVNGERHYFQSKATMDLVNAQATQAGLAAPTRPLAPPGPIPKSDDHNSGHIPQFAAATNGENGKTYLWRWDKTAGRYCAVAEGSSGSDWHWYSSAEYKEKNSGANALVMSGGGYDAPIADNRGEMYDTENNEFRIILDDRAGESGNGDECWGTPIYVYDKNTGHKVYVGVKVYVGDGKEKNYYFDAGEMQQYNTYVPGENGHGYWQAKPLDQIAAGDKRVQDGSQESGADGWR